MSLNALGRLILLRVKIERAKQNLADLERELLPFWNKKLHVAIGQDEPNTMSSAPYLKTLPVYPFNALAIAGDIIHNLRSTLDHLAYHLVLIGSGKVPDRQVEFPIAKDRTTYEADKHRKLKGVRPEVIERIDRLKPYDGGNPVLWRIHLLNNVDKHRFVLTISDDALFEAPWYSDPSGMPFLIRPRTFKTDAPLFTGAFEAEMDYQMNLSIEESRAETQPGKPNFLVESLHEWIACVETLVYSFEPHLG